MSFISNFKKLTKTRGKLPIVYLNLYFETLFTPWKVSILEKLEIKRLKKLYNCQNEDILLFLLEISRLDLHLESLEETETQNSLQIVSQVNYWPILPVEPVNPVDILYKNYDSICINQDDSDKSIDSGYESIGTSGACFDQDVYSIMEKEGFRKVYFYI